MTRQRLLCSSHLCRIHTSDMGMKRNQQDANICTFKASKQLITSMTVDCWHQFKPQLKRDCMWCISNHDNFQSIKSFKLLEIYHLIMFWKWYSTENRRSRIYAPLLVMWKQWLNIFIPVISDKVHGTWCKQFGYTYKPESIKTESIKLNKSIKETIHQSTQFD